MQGRTLVRAVNSAMKVAAIAGFVGFGVGILFMLVKFSSHPDFCEPYPLFGASLARLHTAVVIAYGSLWLFWTIVTLRAVSADNVLPALVVCSFAVIIMLTACAGAVYGVDSANALLDFSSPVRTPVLVREVRSDIGKTRRGASLVVLALVSPIDQPDRQFELNWNSCGVRSPAVVSPFAAVRVGRGVFGAPWVATPVECRALAVGDRPLFGTFRLGSSPLIVATVERGERASVREMRAERRSEMLEAFNGFIDGSPSSPRGQAEAALSAADLALLDEGRAELRKTLEPLLTGDPQAKTKDIGRAAIRIVDEDLRRQDPTYLLSVWKQGIDAAAPNVPMAVIRSDNGAGMLTDFKCSRCSILSEDNVDMEIYREFTGRTARGLGGNQIVLAAKNGRVAFKADLSDTSSLPALVRQLRSIAAQQ